MQPYRKDGLVFAFCAVSAGLTAIFTLTILGPPRLLLSSASGAELLAVLLLQAIIAGLCSAALLSRSVISRRKHLLLLGLCVLTAAGVLLRGWGFAAVFVAAPSLTWAYNLRKVGA